MKQSENLKKNKNYIEMILLSILCEGDCYGYQLSQLIVTYSEGYLSIPEGSLYPALYRLLEEEYISDEKRQIGKRLCRIYYHIEPKGKEYLETMIGDYRRLNEGIYKIINRNKNSFGKVVL